MRCYQSELAAIVERLATDLAQRKLRLSSEYHPWPGSNDATTFLRSFLAALDRIDTGTHEGFLFFLLFFCERLWVFVRAVSFEASKRKSCDGLVRGISNASDRGPTLFCFFVSLFNCERMFDGLIGNCPFCFGLRIAFVLL
jgi:hypothetical protein